MFAFEYENHRKYLAESIQGLFKRNLLVDCTLSAEDQFIHGHQVVLAACSPYLELLFSQNQDRKPIVLNDVKFQALKSLVDFMYFGEVYIPTEQLSSFVKTAKVLQVKGLTNLYKQENNVECSDDSEVNVNNKCEKRKWNFCENTFEIKRDAENHSTVLDTSQREECAELNLNADGCNEDSVRDRDLTFNRGCVNQKSKVDSQNLDNKSAGAQHMAQCVAESNSSSGELKIKYEDNCSAVSLLPFIKEEENESHIMQDDSCSANVFNRNVADVENVIKGEIEIEDNELNFHENQEVTDLSEIISNYAFPFTSQDSLNHVTAVCVISGTDSCNDFKGNFENISEFAPTSPKSDSFEETRGSGGDNIILGLENVDLNVWSSVSHGQGDECRRNGSGLKVYLSDNTVSLEKDETEKARQWESSDQTGLLEDISTITQTALYQCSHCSIEFSDKTKLISHMHVHKKELQYECKLCFERFFDSIRLERHLSVHAGQKKFQCSICFKGFTRSGSLKRHLLSHSGEKKHECTFCSKTFTRSGSLKSHLVTHSGEKNYQCPICSKRFTQSGSLQRHLTQCGKKKYQCTVCSQRFTVSSSLKSHLKTHSGEEKYQCTRCSKRFTLSENLKEHLQTHSGEKRYQCTVCCKRFTKSQHLKNHLLTHSGEKNFQCTICANRFTQLGNLQRHLLTHKGEKNFQCSLCSKRFTLPQTLKKHLLTHSGEKKYQCTICSKRFTESGHLKSHQRTHTGEKNYQCLICSNRFTESGSLKRHLLTHSGEKRYQCSICSKRFTVSSSLKSHLMTHSGVKNYQCTVCSKRFRHRQSLKDHRLTQCGEETFYCAHCPEGFTLKEKLITHLRVHN